MGLTGYGVVYHRRSQPIVKVKWRVKEGEVGCAVSSSMASKTNVSLALTRQEATSNVVKKGVDVGAPTSLVIGQMMTEEDARASRSYIDKTEGIFDESFTKFRILIGFVFIRFH